MLALTLVELVALLSLNGGKLVYTLDDPYIHFALAENLINGHYGVNSTENSAPSSSVIWALILTPFVTLPGFEYLAFVINLVAAALTMLVYSQVSATAVSPGENSGRFWLALALPIGLILGTNLVGLVYTGMEHSFQVLLTALVAAGLIRESRDGTLPGWLLAVIVLGPLFRYENLAVSVPALGYLFFRGHFKASILAGVAVLLPLAAFSLFLNANELGWMPTSVNAKSRYVADEGAIDSLAYNVYINLHYRQALVVVASMLLLIVSAVMPKRPPAERLLAGFAAAGGLLHMMVGQIGWYGRYEIYILVFMLLILIYVWRGILRAAVDRQRLAAPLAVVVLGFAGATYLNVLLTIPVASNNIYQQQYQMHRFITEHYKAPVAVNDLGWVSFRNEHYVLDLYGLASREALEYRQTALDSSWMNDLAEHHDVRLAMIYEGWFGDPPDNWQPLGKIHLGRVKITPAFPSVTIYALDEATEREVVAMLGDFIQTLPDGVIFTDPAGMVIARQ